MALAALPFSFNLQADDEGGGVDAASALPKVGVTASDPVAFRGLSTGAFTVYRDDTNGPLSVKILLSGTASNSVDYAALPNTVIIPAGFHAIGLEVDPLGDGDSSPTETVVLTLSTNESYRLSRPHSAVVLIKGNTFENQAPIVAITSPTDESGLPAKSNLLIAADASDPNDSVEKVSFFAGDRFLGSDKEAPYSLVWSNVPAGKHSLFARAEDSFGKSTLSAAVDIVATNPPTGGGVTLTSPASGASFPAPAEVLLSAKLNDTHAELKSVSYFQGEKLVGTVSAAPFTLAWSNVPPGQYSLRAKATDTAGAVSTSAKVGITVTNGLPTVSILSPANSSTFNVPVDITIEVEAADANGIESVMFFGGEKFLGSDKTAPYSLTWSNAPSGKQTIAARATDIFGASKTASVQIVISNTAPTVKLLTPTNNASFTSPATIELTAEASDTDGIEYVSFWAGNERLGEDRTAPYSLTLNRVGRGSYIFSAHAVDKFGARATSEPVKVTVARP